MTLAQAIEKASSIANMPGVLKVMPNEWTNWCNETQEELAALTDGLHGSATSTAGATFTAWIALPSTINKAKTASFGTTAIDIITPEQANEWYFSWQTDTTTTGTPVAAIINGDQFRLYPYKAGTVTFIGSRIPTAVSDVDSSVDAPAQWLWLVPYGMAWRAMIKLAGSDADQQRAAMVKGTWNSALGLKSA